MAERYVLFKKRGKKSNRRVFWHNESLNEWPLTVAEIREAADKAFDGIFLGLLILEQDVSGVEMRIDAMPFSDSNEKVVGRYQIKESNNSKSKCVLWYNDILWGDKLTLAEIEAAVQEEYSEIDPKRIILQKFDCGIVMREEYPALVEKCNRYFERNNLRR